MAVELEGTFVAVHALSGSFDPDGLSGEFAVAKKNQNATIYSGNDASIKVTMADGKSDITTAVYIVRKYALDGPEILRVTATVASTVLTAALTPSQTQELSGTYSHEMEATDAAGDVATVMVGTLTVTKRTP